jgi:hypothetical protein
MVGDGEAAIGNGEAVLAMRGLAGGDGGGRWRCVKVGGGEVGQPDGVIWPPRVLKILSPGQFVRRGRRWRGGSLVPV